MSISFQVTDGERFFMPEPKHELWINVNNSNARDLFVWLGLGHPETLELSNVPRILLNDFAARCRRRLWDEPRNHDPALPMQDFGGPDPEHARVIFVGRRAGYLRDQTKRLLQLAEYGLKNGFTHIYWG